MTTEDEFGFPIVAPELDAWLEADARERAEAEHRRKHPDFTARRQQELAAERDACRRRLDRGELIIEAPTAGDPPETVAVVINRLEAMPGVSRQARDARGEAYRILLDGALAMSRSGLRLEGRPADAALAPKPSVEPPAPRRSPHPTKASTEPAKARKTPQKAAQLSVTPQRKPKVRPAPEPKVERPAPPDEIRCAAMNRKGTRCRMEAVADGKCVLHGSAG